MTLSDSGHKPQRVSPLVFAGLLVGVGLGFLALLGMDRLGWISLGLNFPQSSRSLAEAARLDQSALDFELKDLSGQQFLLSELKGRVVLLNFWATWCGPCEQEMPVLQRAHDKYGSDLVVIGVNMAEPAESVRRFVQRLGLTYRILLDLQGEVGDAYQVYMLPITFFIDRQGVLRYRHIGSITDAQLQTYLVQLGVGE